MALDLTWNTDFAQVEADNVQINLTRFSLFFPEKREFFLERAGLFQFGRPRETEVFFSRRVGLDADVVGGSRITGQAGPHEPRRQLKSATDRTRIRYMPQCVTGAVCRARVQFRGELQPRSSW